jgi:hypothetical protein
VHEPVIFKITRFLQVPVILFLIVFATTAFAMNYAVDTALKEPRGSFNHGEHSGLVPIGDPVDGGGTPCGGNQTSNGNG